MKIIPSAGDYAQSIETQTWTGPVPAWNRERFYFDISAEANLPAAFFAAEGRFPESKELGAQVLRIDLLAHDGAVFEGVPEIDVWIGGNSVAQIRTAHDARLLAGALLLAARDLEEIDAE